MKNFFSYFSKLEMALWWASVFLIIASFLVFDRTNYLTLIASVIGVTSLIFNAKGNPFGNNQLCGGVFNLSQKPLFCLGLCRKRYGFNCFVGVGKHNPYSVSLGGGVLRGIPLQ